MGDDIRRLVFSDEIWAKTKMTPLRGWAARGKRLIGKACFGPTTPDQVPGRLFIATLRHDATTAIWVINGPIYGDIFRTCVEAMLAATLREGGTLASGK